MEATPRDKALRDGGLAALCKWVRALIDTLADATLPKETTETILPEQTMTFVTMDYSPPGIAQVDTEGAIGLEDGATYRVTFDGAEYECACFAMPIDSDVALIAGNTSMGGVGDDTGEPFLLFERHAVGDGGTDKLLLSRIFTTTDPGVDHTISVAKIISTLSRYYTKAEVDAALGSYINDIDALLGVDDAAIEGGGT